MRGHPLSHRDHFAADHQYPVVVAWIEALHDHAPAVRRRQPVGAAHLLVGLQVDADAAAVIAVQRLDHHRPAQPPRLAHRVLGVAHHRAARHRQPRLVEQLLGQVLLPRRLHRQVRGAPGDAGPDPLLPPPVAQLHQAVVVQPHDGDVAPLRLRHQRLGARPEALAPHQPAQLLDRRGDVELPGGEAPPVLALVVQPVEPFDPLEVFRQQALHQFQRQPPGVEADRLLLVGVHHVVDAGLALHRARLAALHLRPGEPLELDRDVLRNVAEPGAVAQPPREPARLLVAAAMILQRRQQRQQPLRELRQLVGGEALQRAEVHLHADHRYVAVEVRAAIGAPLQHPHRPRGRRGLAHPRTRSETRSRRGSVETGPGIWMVIYLLPSAGKSAHDHPGSG